MKRSAINIQAVDISCFYVSYPSDLKPISLYGDLIIQISYFWEMPFSVIIQPNMIEGVFM